MRKAAIPDEPSPLASLSGMCPAIEFFRTCSNNWADQRAAGLRNGLADALPEPCEERLDHAVSRELEINPAEDLGRIFELWRVKKRLAILGILKFTHVEFAKRVAPLPILQGGERGRQIVAYESLHSLAVPGILPHFGSKQKNRASQRKLFGIIAFEIGNKAGERRILIESVRIVAGFFVPVAQ